MLEINIKRIFDEIIEDIYFKFMRLIILRNSKYSILNMYNQCIDVPVMSVVEH